MMDVRNRFYEFDDVRIDVQNLRVTVGKEIRPLEPKSFRLLVFLVENPGRALTKDEIMAAVWPGAFVSDNSLARAITQIRKALDDDPKAPRYVETVPTVGYRFIGVCKQEQSVVGVEAGTDEASTKVTRRRGGWALGVGVVLAVLAGVGVWMVQERRAAEPYPLRVVRSAKLTDYPGDEREPAVSPDGSTVAFSWSGAEGNNYDIYVVKPGEKQPLRLTTDPAADTFPAWSPDGSQIAFVRRKGEFAEIVMVPPLGGPERVLYQFSRIGADLDFSQHPVLSWSPDGKAIVYSGQSGPGEKFRLFLLSVESGAVQVLSTPDANGVGDSSPAFSSDGRFLAFVRYLAPRNGQVMVQALDSGMVPLGDPMAVNAAGLDPRSPMWLVDGKRLLFADSAQIFEWDQHKGTTPIYAANGALGGLALGPRMGNALQLVAAVEKLDHRIWEIPLDATGMKATGPPRSLPKSESDSHPDYSPDGRLMTLISARSGAAEVWVANADGSNPRQLTHLGARVASYPKWSPDGTKIAFHARVPDVAEVYVVDPDQGVPRQITHENPGLALATWSNDGRFLYASTLVGGIGMTYRFPATGGPMQRLWEGALARESVDGKYILYWKTNTPGIYNRCRFTHKVKLRLATDQQLAEKLTA